MTSTQPCAILPLQRGIDPSGVVVPVAGKPPLVRILGAVLHRVPAARVVVGATADVAADVHDCLNAADLAEVTVIVVAEPGSRRQILRSGLEHLGLKALSSTGVLVCDHRFPLPSGEVVARVLDGLTDGRDVVVPVLSVTDTVKTVDDHGSVLGTVDRSALRTVQYPRGFAAATLWDAISTSPESPPGDGDEFGWALRAGLDVGTVAGDPDNLHFQLPRDAALLDAVIGCRPS